MLANECCGLGSRHGVRLAWQMLESPFVTVIVPSAAMVNTCCTVAKSNPALFIPDVAVICGVSSTNRRMRSRIRQMTLPQRSSVPFPMRTPIACAMVLRVCSSVSVAARRWDQYASIAPVGGSVPMGTMRRLRTNVGS